MANLGYYLWQLLFLVPELAILVTGIVLIAARRSRLTPKSRALGTAGCAVLLGVAVINSVYLALLPELVQERGYAGSAVPIGVANILFVLLHATGLALLVTAVVTGAAPSDGGAAPFQGGAAPSDGGAAHFHGGAAPSDGGAARFDGWAPVSRPDA